MLCQPELAAHKKATLTKTVAVNQQVEVSQVPTLFPFTCSIACSDYQVLSDCLYPVAQLCFLLFGLVIIKFSSDRFLNESFSSAG